VENQINAQGQQPWAQRDIFLKVKSKQSQSKKVTEGMGVQW